MREDFEKPISQERPLVSGLESIDASSSGYRNQSRDRDEAIIMLLREKLREKSQGNVGTTTALQAPEIAEAPSEDKYEPQRLSRKICWQYDGNAKRVPILRRPYI